MRSRLSLVLAAGLGAFFVGSCAEYESAQEDVFGMPPPPGEEDLDEGGSSSSGDNGSSGAPRDADALPACPGVRTFQLDASFGTLNAVGGEAVATADGTKINVDARTSAAYQRVIEVRRDCPLELTIATTGFSSSNGHFLDLVWIDYRTATRFGTIEVGGYSPSFEDTDDTFALTRSTCDQSGCDAADAEDVDVSGATVALHVPLAGAGVPRLEVDGIVHTDARLVLPTDPITELTLHVGQRSIDDVEGTITYRSVSLNTPSP